MRAQIPFAPAAVLAAVATLLTACGGGSSGDGVSSVGGGLSDIQASAAAYTLAAGSSTPITMAAAFRGDTPSNLRWAVTALTPQAAGAPVPVVGDPSCSNAALVPPPTTNGSGQGACNTVVTFPSSMESSTWRLTATSGSSKSGSVSKFFDISVAGLPKTGFRALEPTAPFVGYTNAPLSLSVPFRVDSGVEVRDVRYTWTALEGNPGNPAIAGASTPTPSIVPFAEGQYRFAVTISAMVNGNLLSTKAEVAVIVYKESLPDQISAGNAQSAAAGSIVELGGVIAGQDPALSYRYTWAQLSGAEGGPERLQISNTNALTASFRAPATAGSYGFELTVEKVQRNGQVQTTRSRTFVHVNEEAMPVFNVSVGSAQNVLAGQVVNLPASIAFQGDQPAGSRLTYRWEVVAAPEGVDRAAVRITSANSLSASFIPPSKGVYELRLTVTATTAQGRTSTVVNDVEVVADSKPLKPAYTLTASAGPVVTGPVGQVVNVTGSEDVQGDATGATYTRSWTVIRGPAPATLSGATTPSASFLPTVQGIYELRYTVRANFSDGRVVTSTSDTTAVISKEDVNKGFAFSVNAGPVRIAPSGSPVSLTGTVEAQGPTTGVTYAYAWSIVSQPSGSAVSLANSSSKDSGFIPVLSGDYVLRLTVVATKADGTTSTSSGETTIVVGAGAKSFSVSAGNAQTGALNTPVTLSSTTTRVGDLDSTPITYLWEQVGTSPTEVTVANAGSAVASFIPTQAGTYTFRVTATGVIDGVVTTKIATTQVLVAGSGAFTFTVSAGDATRVQPGSAVTLAGAVNAQGASSGVSYQYAWTVVTQPAGSSVQLSNPNTLNASFTPSVTGEYRFRLTVTATQADGSTQIRSSETSVVVGAATKVFTVSAGDSQVTTVNTAATLTGAVQRQGDFTGVTFTYQWTQVGTDPVAVLISNANAQTASFIPPQAGTYTFQLTVTADENGTQTVKSSTTQVLAQ